MRKFKYFIILLRSRETLIAILPFILCELERSGEERLNYIIWWKKLRKTIRKMSSKIRKNRLYKRKERLKEVQIFKEIYVALYYFDIIYIFISMNDWIWFNSISDNNWIINLFEGKYNVTYRHVNCSLGI